MTYEVKFGMPLPAEQLDVRYSVTITDDGLPWPIRFFYLRTDTEEWATVGFEMGVGPVSRIGLPSLDSDTDVLADGPTRWVLDNFSRYERIARSWLSGGRTEMKAPRKQIRTGGRGHREDRSDVFLAGVAADYAALGGQRGCINYLASEYGVHRTTIWRWLQRAKKSAG